MNYQEVLNYIHSVRNIGVKYGLQNIKILLDKLGNPQDKLKFVHVAGTNGKGSTVSFISNILIRAGYKTGIFTSPYLEKFNERIRVDTKDIDDDRIVDITQKVRRAVEEMKVEGYNHPTEFEIVTAIGFQYFYEEKCDIVVLEVGLGGRLDATNVIKKPEVAVITSIDLDHTELLGETIVEIAGEKAGIIKEGCDVVLYPQALEVEDLLLDICRRLNSYLHAVKTQNIVIKTSEDRKQIFDYKEFKDIEIGMLGSYQILNAVTAIDCAMVLNRNGFKIKNSDIYEGLKGTHWPGRLEILRGDPLIILDGSHNPQGAKMLAEFLNQKFKNYNKIVVFSCMQGKDILEISKEIGSFADHVIAVKPNNVRAEDVGKICDLFLDCGIKCEKIESVESGIKRGVSVAKEKDMIVVCGSLYLVGEVKGILKRLK